MLKLSPLGPSPKHQNHRLVRSPKLHSALEALHFWEFVTPTAEAAGVVHRWKTGPFFLQCGSAEPTRGHSHSPCALTPHLCPVDLRIKTPLLFTSPFPWSTPLSFLLLYFPPCVTQEGKGVLFLLLFLLFSFSATAHARCSESLR